MTYFYNALFFLIGTMIGSSISIGYFALQMSKERNSPKKTGVTCDQCQMEITEEVDMDRLQVYTDRVTGKKKAYLKPYKVLRAEGNETLIPSQRRPLHF